VSRCLDTSVLLASLDADEVHHAACDRLMSGGDHTVYVHALAETFSILTGGRKGRRLSAATAAQLIEHSVLPFVKVQALSGREVMGALLECEARGVCGGAIYDWLHLAAARKAGAEVLVTLDARDFQALSKPGDPRIESV
jgi:predicted nucleic acid-binding protein